MLLLSLIFLVWNVVELYYCYIYCTRTVRTKHVNLQKKNSRKNNNNVFNRCGACLHCFRAWIHQSQAHCKHTSASIILTFFSFTELITVFSSSFLLFVIGSFQLFSFLLCFYSTIYYADKDEVQVCAPSFFHLINSVTIQSKMNLLFLKMKISGKMLCLIILPFLLLISIGWWFGRFVDPSIQQEINKN